MMTQMYFVFPLHNIKLNTNLVNPLVVLHILKEISYVETMILLKKLRILEEYDYDRVSTGVLNFRASLYRDQFKFFGPYWYLNF